MRSKSPSSEELRARILQTIDNEPARKFWEYDFDKYRNEDFSPPRNKLSKLLLTGTVSLMLSQPDSAFRLSDVLNHGKILLVNLAHVGTQVRGILGCLLLSLIRQDTLRRNRIPELERPEAHTYCDEARCFMTDAIEDVLAEARKYRVGMTLAHQWIGQFGYRKAEALSSVGTTLIFNVDRNDAQHLTKDLLGKVTFDDLAALPDYHAIARIRQHVVRIHTIAPPSFMERGTVRPSLRDPGDSTASRAPKWRPWFGIDPRHRAVQVRRLRRASVFASLNVRITVRQHLRAVWLRQRPTTMS